MDKIEKIKSLEYKLRLMNIPLNRRVVNLNNLKWLKKNLARNNSDNKHYAETRDLVEFCLQNRYYYS